MPVIGLDVRPIETERDAECRVELSNGAGNINPSAGEMATDDGQPLPGGGLKQMLSDMAASGVWDVESDGEITEPRLIP